jgi:hypothetical protein
VRFDCFDSAKDYCRILVKLLEKLNEKGWDCTFIASSNIWEISPFDSAIRHPNVQTKSIFIEYSLYGTKFRSRECVVDFRGRPGGFDTTANILRACLTLVIQIRTFKW